MLVGALALSTFSCRKGLEKPNWDVDLVAPVFKTTLTLGDIIPDSLQHVNPDSSVSLVFNNTVFRAGLDSLVDLPDTTITEDFVIPVTGFSIAPGALIYGTTEETSYDVGDAELQLIKLREGTISFTLSSSLSEDHVVNFKMVNSAFNTLAGPPFEMELLIPAGSIANPTLISESIDLSGYWVDLTGSTGFEVNTLTTEITLSNGANSGTLISMAGDNASIDFTFSDLVPEYARGFFGSREITLQNDDTEFDVFSSVISGTLDIGSVDMDLEIINGIGIDAQATISRLGSFNSENSLVVDLNHSIIGNTLNISRAQDNGGVVTPSMYSTSINSSNSNFDLFLENLPDKVEFDLNLNVNPFGNASNGNDFIYFDHPFEARLNIDLPLCLIANSLTLADTFELQLDEDEQQGRFDRATFTIVADNGFPFDADLSLLLLDGAGGVPDTLLADSRVLAAEVDANLDVVAPVSSSVTIIFEKEQIDRLYNEETKLVLFSAFTTVDQTQHVKLYDHYSMGLRVTTDFNYVIELEWGT